MLAFSIAIPFLTAGLPGDSIYNIEVTHQQMKFRLIHEDAIVWVLLLAIALGCLTGMLLFGFLRTKKESTIFLSLGMTRKRLFWNRILVGSLILFLSVAIPMLISMGLNLQALGNYEGLVRNTSYLIYGLFLVEMISFVLAVLAAIVSGTLREVILYWAILIATPSLLCEIVNRLLKSLYWGNVWGVYDSTQTTRIAASLLERFAAYNPLLFFQTECETHAQFYRPLTSAVPDALSPAAVIGWSIALALLIFLAWKAMQKRKAEAAEMVGSNPVLMEWVIFLTSMWMFAEVFALLNRYHRILAIVGASGVVIGLHFFWRKGVWRVEESKRKAVRAILVQLATMAAVCVCLSSGLSSFRMYQLQKADLQSVEVTYVGAPSYFTEEISGSSTGRGYYLNSQMTFEDAKEMEAVLEIHELFQSQGKKSLQETTVLEETMIPYDVIFTYTDTNGKTMKWYYDRSSYAQLEALLSLEMLPSMQAKQAQLFESSENEEVLYNYAKSAYQTQEIYFTDRYFSQTYRLELTQGEREELLSCIAQDLANQTLEERYFPTEQTRVVLMFSQNESYDTQYFTYHLDNPMLYLKDSDTHTMTWLDEQGFLSLLPEEVVLERAIVQRMDPYIGMNPISVPIGMYFMSYWAERGEEFLIQKDFGNPMTITSAEQLEELQAGLQNGYYMTRGGYFVAVQVSGLDGYRYFYLPDDAVPSFLQK
jgi:ABC-2 type transport system permease protein